ncbi:hypothetical protein FRB91_011375 [Serendipita sp. 411]|nr:hypothetical protein FRC15_001218 [Serendipita sp. 397]KAG8821209.1 hypothetical protein FRC19_008158 [Serendipita sp. 401]KAG8833388.1 hypothetical protein FRC18_003690 [Serendipita sp. 400]KAG8847883.1 hypothetical protein FRB91_011375 [Serendipita sp. 411]
MLSNSNDVPQYQGPSSYTSIGILIAIAGNVLISLALNLQKVAHKHLHDAANATRKTKKSGRSTTAHNQGTSPSTPSHPNGISTPPNPTRSSSTLNTISPEDTLPQHNAALESRPLLPRTASSPVPLQNYGALKSKKLFNLPRINVFRRPLPPSLQSPISENGLLHEEEEEEDGHDEDDELDESMAGGGAETDYLRSKLWYSSFLLLIPSWTLLEYPCAHNIFPFKGG